MAFGGTQLVRGTPDFSPSNQTATPQNASLDENSSQAFTNTDQEKIKKSKKPRTALAIKVFIPVVFSVKRLFIFKSCCVFYIFWCFSWDSFCWFWWCLTSHGAALGDRMSSISNFCLSQSLSEVIIRVSKC